MIRSSTSQLEVNGMHVLANKAIHWRMPKVTLKRPCHVDCTSRYFVSAGFLSATRRRYEIPFV